MPEAETIEVGTVVVACPWCQEEIGIPVTAILTEDDNADDDLRHQYLRCESDMADLWAHTWTHQV